jgi:hypothetical protein
MNIGRPLENGVSYFNLANEYEIPENHYAIGYIPFNAPKNPYTGIQNARYIIYNQLTGDAKDYDFETDPLAKRLNPFIEGDPQYRNAPVTPFVFHNGHNYAKIRDLRDETGNVVYSFYKNMTDGNIYMEQDGEFYQVDPTYFDKIRMSNYQFRNTDMENMIYGKRRMAADGTYRMVGSM